MVLTDKQISALDVRIDEFRAADYESQEEMVQGFLGSFKRACPQGIKFDAITVKTICASLANIGLLSNISSLFASTFMAISNQK